MIKNTCLCRNKMPYADVRVYVEKATWLYLADYDKLT